MTNSFGIQASPVLEITRCKYKAEIQSWLPQQFVKKLLASSNNTNNNKYPENPNVTTLKLIILWDRRPKLYSRSSSRFIADVLCSSFDSTVSILLWISLTTHWNATQNGVCIALKLCSRGAFDATVDRMLSLKFLLPLFTAFIVFLRQRFSTWTMRTQAFRRRSTPDGSLRPCERRLVFSERAPIFRSCIFKQLVRDVTSKKGKVFKD